MLCHHQRCSLAGCPSNRYLDLGASRGPEIFRWVSYCSTHVDRSAAPALHIDSAHYTDTYRPSTGATVWGLAVAAALTSSALSVAASWQVCACFACCSIDMLHALHAVLTLQGLDKLSLCRLTAQKRHPAQRALLLGKATILLTHHACHWPHMFQSHQAHAPSLSLPSHMQSH